MVYLCDRKFLAACVDQVGLTCRQTASLVRTQAIITQLVFEHALRIRLETGSKDNVSSTSAQPVSGNGKKGTTKGAESNIVGKINNLVSSNLEDIINGRDFLMLSAIILTFKSACMQG